MGGPPPYHAPPLVLNGGYDQNGGYGIPSYPPGMPPAQAQVHRLQYFTWSSIMQIGLHTTHADLMSQTTTQV
jgi:hypothetical protein